MAVVSGYPLSRLTVAELIREVDNAETLTTTALERELAWRLADAVVAPDFFKHEPELLANCLEVLDDLEIEDAADLREAIEHVVAITRDMDGQQRTNRLAKVRTLLDSLNPDDTTATLRAVADFLESL